MISRPMLAMLVLAMAACTSPRVTRPTLCNYSDFEISPYDHIIERVNGASVSEFAGRLGVRPRDVTDGVWPRGLEARIELHGPDGLTEVLRVSDSGTFERKGLRPGTYCFKVSASGFRSVLGTVVIDREARKTAPIEIELIIAE